LAPVSADPKAARKLNWRAADECHYPQLPIARQPRRAVTQ